MILLERTKETKGPADLEKAKHFACASLLIRITSSEATSVPHNRIDTLETNWLTEY
jgi:hypothetical protein